MENERIAGMADKIARSVTSGPDNDEALVNVDGALDAMIAAVMAIEENLPHVKTVNAPQKAAVDAVQDLMDTAINPYLADIVSAMEIFGG